MMRVDLDECLGLKGHGCTGLQGHGWMGMHGCMGREEHMHLGPYEGVGTLEDGVQSGGKEEGTLLLYQLVLPVEERLACCGGGGGDAPLARRIHSLHSLCMQGPWPSISRLWQTTHKEMHRRI